MTTEPQGLLLAAGAARRFGTDKRRARLPGGAPLLLTTIMLWRQAGLPLRVVLRAEDLALGQDLITRWPALTVTHAERWREGMGASLAAGARDCSNTAPLLIGLADMPWVLPATLRALASTLRAAARLNPLAIVRPQHDGQWGHPVGFGPAHLTSLQDLHGDQGARSLIRMHREHLQALPCNDAGCIRDVDYPADLDGSRAST